MARIYRPRPSEDRVEGEATNVRESEAPGGPWGSGPGSTELERSGLKTSVALDGATGQSPSGVVAEGRACWECRLTAEVHRHWRAEQSGGLWQEGYRVPCNCAVVGGTMEGGGAWDPLLGHHYRCIWWSFQEQLA